MAFRHACAPGGADMAPLLTGLPGDRCPSPHWGIVLAGSIHMVHADGTTETVRAGEVYHWPTGHTGTTDEPVEFLEIGPVEPMRQFNRHVTAMFAASCRPARVEQPRGSRQVATGEAAVMRATVKVRTWALRRSYAVRKPPSSRNGSTTRSVVTPAGSA
jgi:hypothetical protein